MKFLLITASLLAYAGTASAQELEQGTNELVLQYGETNLSFRNDFFTGNTYELGYVFGSGLVAAVEYYEETEEFGVSASYGVAYALDSALFYGDLDLTVAESFTSLDTVVGVDYFVDPALSVYAEVGAKSLVDQDWLRASSYVEGGIVANAQQFAIVPAVRYEFETEQYLGNISLIYNF